MLGHQEYVAEWPLGLVVEALGHDFEVQGSPQKLGIGGSLTSGPPQRLHIPPSLEMGGFQNLGALFGSPYDEDHNILESILGPPIFGDSRITSQKP